jgi:MmyB-like transcription regulator ligand binding domain
MSTNYYERLEQARGPRPSPTVLAAIARSLRLSAEVFGRLAGQADPADNMVWRWFTDPAWRASWAPTETRDATAAGFVADLRALAAQRGHDPATARFVGELRAASDEFAQNWDQHDVYSMRPGSEVLHHPQVGRLALECAVVQGQAPGQRLFLFRAAAGTPTGGRLAALAGRSEADVTGS